MVPIEALTHSRWRFPAGDDRSMSALGFMGHHCTNVRVREKETGLLLSGRLSSYTASGTDLSHVRTIVECVGVVASTIDNQHLLDVLRRSNRFL